jgi:hypothetical protein
MPRESVIDDILGEVRSRKKMFCSPTTDEDRWSTTAVFPSDFLPPVILSDVESTNALGKVLAVDSLVL